MNLPEKTTVNLVPDTVNPTPDYYCTWQTQLYATNDGKPAGQRRIIGEKALFSPEKPYGWAYFYEKARGDLFFIMDDSWDVPPDNDERYFGSLILNGEKYPEAVGKAQSNADAIKRLSERMKSIGWKGLGGWVCAQEAAIFGDSDRETYWTERLKDADAAGFSYWKVDWGSWGSDAEERRRLTLLGRKYAPKLIIEHAITPEIIPFGDVFRTYDVPAIMSIPMTMNKIAAFTDTPAPQSGNTALINCEDEAYLSAACGFAMGIMRHPYSGTFMNGKADMSFPAVHRNLKTKMYEVLRAARWHRIAPAFSFDGGGLSVSKDLLTDTWRLEKPYEEIEQWWFDNTLIAPAAENGVLKISAPAAVARNTALPEIKEDENGKVPFAAAAQNTNGAFSVVTLGRTEERRYFIPKCDVTVKSGGAALIGVFGEYKNLIVETELAGIKRILIQDLADDTAYDITEHVIIKDGEVVIPGELIKKIGTLSQPKNDTSEPGAVVFLDTGLPTLRIWDHIISPIKK